MNVLNDILKYCSILGLGKLDLRIYVTLVSKGPLTAQELSESTGIPLSKIYTYLKRLEVIGLIHKTDERPARFYPIPPIMAWQKLRKRAEEELKLIEEKFLTILQTIYDNRVRSVPFKGLMILYGFERIMDEILRVISVSKGTLLVAMPFKEFLTEPILTALKSREYKVRMLIAPDMEIPSSLFKGNIEIRVKDNMFGGGVIGSNVILIVKYMNTYTAIVSDYEYFRDIATVYFNRLWNESLEYKKS